MYAIRSYYVLVLADGNSKVETSEYSGAQLDEIASDDSSLKAVSGIPENNIIQKIEVQDSPLEFQLARGAPESSRQCTGSLG